jgi:hypothetical protein
LIDLASAESLAARCAPVAGNIPADRRQTSAFTERDILSCGGDRLTFLHSCMDEDLNPVTRAFQPSAILVLVCGGRGHKIRSVSSALAIFVGAGDAAWNQAPLQLRPGVSAGPAVSGIQSLADRPCRLEPDVAGVGELRLP